MFEGGNKAKRFSEGRGYSLIEVLVVISVVSVLASVLVPALVKVRHKAKVVLGVTRQREIVGAAVMFSIDNDDRYPESVATIGQGDFWNWSEPRMVTAKAATYPGLHRAMSEHFRGYIDDASIMYCPSAPRKYKYLQAAWEAGDSWDNPDNLFPWDPVTGVYCFYWNYTGYLAECDFLFKGPRRLAGRRGESKILMTDYFGFDHWRSRDAWGSCEKFNGASVTVPGALLTADHWFGGGYDSLVSGVRFNAGYTDGHVESYSGDDVVTMKVIIDRDTNEPYPDGVGPGNFYLPRNGLR